MFHSGLHVRRFAMQYQLRFKYLECKIDCFVSFWDESNGSARLHVCDTYSHTHPRRASGVKINSKYCWVIKMQRMKNKNRIHFTIEHKRLCIYGTKGDRAALEVTEEKETRSSLNRIIAFNNTFFFIFCCCCCLCHLIFLRNSSSNSVRFERWMCCTEIENYRPAQWRCIDEMRTKDRNRRSLSNK